MNSIQSHLPDSTIAIPSFLHDVFGERQSPFELSAIIAVGLATTLAAIALAAPQAAEVAQWKLVVAWIIFADVVAGAVANFSRGTSGYYAARPKNRWVFIAIHVHLLAMAWLLAAPMLPAVACWLYTVLSATVVNSLAGDRRQCFVAGCLLVVGFSVLLLQPMASTFMLLASALFLFKVSYSFAVDHYGDVRKGETSK